MADWIHFLFHTAALVSGLASLLFVRQRGTRKEALRSIQTLASEAAACSLSSVVNSPGDSRRSLECIGQSRMEIPECNHIWNSIQ
jgi:hypothetical protein